MDIPIYIVNAFSAQPFQGNPAAVCPLPSWLPDATLQGIAAQNNLSETAYFVPGEAPQRLRWFTPTAEVELCGHGTLATAYTIFELLRGSGDQLSFETRSGAVAVRRLDGGYELDFPSQPGTSVETDRALVAALGARPRETIVSTTPYCIFDTEAQLRDLRPNPDALARLNIVAIGVTAPGGDVDFVSRYFAPGVGIPEDPVTGSAHCTLTPYWAHQLNKDTLRARQVSARGGELQCTLRGDRVGISGQCNLYLEGRITI